MSSGDNSTSVCSRADFVAFVHRLSRDVRANPRSWENKDLGDYLEALAAWVEDMDGYYLHRGLPVPERPDWQNVAEMLMAAKFYE